MGQISKTKKTASQARREETALPGTSKGPPAPHAKRGVPKSVSKAMFSLMIVLVLISSSAVYFNSLFDGFVYDDDSQVLRNPWITGIRHVPEIFSRSVWGFLPGQNSANYYRPMMHLLYMFTHHLFGLKPWGFHLVNMLFHAGVSVLVFVITARLLGASGPPASRPYLPALMAALLFATHPVHTEAVTWVAALPDVSFTFFYLLSFFFFIRKTGGALPGKGDSLFSVASFLLAVFCKEPALTLPLILAAYDRTFRGEEVCDSSFLKKYVPYLAVVAAYLLLRFHALGDFAPARQHADLSRYEYFINIFPLFVQYLGKLILPVDLNAFHVLHPISSLFEVKGILSFVITTAFLVLACRFLRRDRVVFFALLFMIVPLLPVLYIPVLGKNTLAERYLYLSSFGFTLLWAALINWTRMHRPSAFTGLIVITVLITGLYSWETFKRNTVWEDNYTLFSDTVGKSPDGDIPHYNLGEALVQRGRIDEAMEHYQIALDLNPGYAVAHNNLGILFFRKGWLDKAIEQYQDALQSNPDYTDAHHNLGLAFFRKGELDKAIDQYQAALKLEPDHAESRNNLGLAFLHIGLPDKAIEQYQAALRSDPGNAEAHNNLGVVFYNKGWLDRAIEQYQTALRFNPDYADAHNNLGAAFHLKGRLREAIGEYQTALRLNPDYSDARRNLAAAYALTTSTDKPAEKKP